MERKIKGDILVFDIETKTEGKPNPEKDILRVFGGYSYKIQNTKKPFLLTNVEDIQKVIDSHKFLVGFNIKKYDIPILERAGIKIEYKIIIDMFEIFKERAGAMKVKKGMLGDLLMSYSLDYISKTIGIVNEKDSKIKGFDYTILNKQHWTQEDIKQIKKYTLRDIEITKKMYEFLEEYFAGFKDFLRDDDIKKKKYLTCSIAGFAYKAICKAMKWKEEYDTENRIESYGGGYVAFPADEKIEGNLLMFDFSSLYPNMFIQGNLFGSKCECCSDADKWRGNNFFHLEGIYCSKKLNPLGELLKRFYEMRKKMKKNKDPKEYSIKIIINTSYGCVANPVFKRVFNLTAAKDCTSLGRQIIKYTRKRFREEGYINIMSDTDSVVIKVPEGKTKEDAQKLANDIVVEVQKHFPFSWNNFELELEHELSHAFFFKGKQVEDKESDKEMDEDDFKNKPKGLLKKNYILVTKDKQIILKNLGVKKKSTSLLSRKIFWDFLVPQIKETHEVKFSKVYLQNLIMELLQEDISLATMRKSVNPYETYMNSSPTGLSAQIAQRYGAGIHFLIPNVRKVGVGKGKSYCTLEEFKERKLRVDDIDLSNIWKELEYFTKPAVVKNIFDYV